MHPEREALFDSSVLRNPEGGLRKGWARSVPGQSSLFNTLLEHMATKAAQAGFTLIEMLVVLMIMGLFVGLVSTITRPDDRAVLRLEAERLSQLLDFATTEARLTGKSIAWSADESGYRFARSDDNAVWSEIRDNELLRARTLPLGMAVSSFRVENMRPQGAMRLEFTPRGSALAFIIGMSLGTERYSVTGSPVGEVRVIPGDARTSGDAALR